MSGRESWTHDKCVQYESARETVTSLMGYRSLWIARERAKASPNEPLIATWRAERAALARELRGLVVTDVARVSRLRSEYGPEVQRLVAAERAQQA
jgi:hypothetical protein